MNDLPENCAVWDQADLVAEVETLRDRIARAETVIDEHMHNIPCFGPVDGTGKPDPSGWLMVDYSVDDEKAMLREILHALRGTTVARSPRSRS
jgi:hypothetical protein